MNGKSFVTGLGMGLAAGMAIGAAMMPQKKSAGSRIMKMLSDVADSLSCVIG